MSNLLARTVLDTLFLNKNYNYKRERGESGKKNTDINIKVDCYFYKT